MLKNVEFITAVSNNNIEKVEEFLKSYKADKDNDVDKSHEINKSHEVDINYQHVNKSLITPASALHIAVAKSHYDVVELLLSKKSTNVDAVTNTGRTALHLAASSGDLRACRLLLDKASVEIKDNKGETPYEIAKAFTNAVDVNKRQKYLEIVELLKIPTFVLACRSGQIELAQKIVREEKIDVNDVYKGTTALNEACYLAQSDVVKFLLSLPKIDVNKTDADGVSPLHMVVHPAAKKIIAVNSESEYRDRKYIAEKLLEKGAMINARVKSNGATPLLHAVLVDAVDIVKILVINGADLTFKYKRNEQESNWTADILEYAANHKQEIYNYLKEAKNGVNDGGFDVAKKLVANSQTYQFNPPPPRTGFFEKVTNLFSQIKL